MAWIEYSYRLDTRIAAPVEWVWRYLVDPALMPQSRPDVIVAVTAVGVLGHTEHEFFYEVMHDHGAHAFKSKVLRGEEPSIWCTLTEIPGWSGKEYYSLSPSGDGAFTDVAFLGSVREDTGDLPSKQLRALTRERADEAQAREEEAATYFARVVSQAFEAAAVATNREARSADDGSRVSLEDPGREIE